MKQIGDADVLQSKVDGDKKGDGGDSTYMVPELWHRERYRGGEKNWKSCFTVVHGQDCRVFACIGTAGLVLPNSNGIPEERVFGISEGDVIPVPSGMTTWWFNSKETDFTIVFFRQQQLI
ncbi:Cupin 1 protein [Raphanus sativus]|nr:Cupin 1 protein [Raphanus sativus]